MVYADPLEMVGESFGTLHKTIITIIDSLAH